MKKHTIFISLFMVAVILFSVGVSAFVAKKTYPSIEDVLREQSSEDRELLLDSSLYVTEDDPEKQMKQKYADDKPLLKIYAEHFLLPNSHLPLEERCEQYDFYSYVVLDKHLYSINVSAKDKTAVSINKNEISEKTHLLRVLEDLRVGSAMQQFCGIECHIEEVVCFYNSITASATLYFVTDQDIFVRYYENGDYPAVAELRMSDFQAYSAKAQEEAEADIKNAAEEAGELIIGRTPDLVDVLEENAPETLSPGEWNVCLLIRLKLVIPLTVILVFAAGITAVVIYNKRKKATPPQEEQPLTEA